MTRWSSRRRENANIHDNSPGRSKSLVPTAAVDSLEACVFMLNRISVCILSKLDPSRSGRPSESLVKVIQYRRCGRRYSIRCGAWRSMLSVLSRGRSVHGEYIKIVSCCLSKSPSMIVTVWNLAHGGLPTSGALRTCWTKGRITPLRQIWQHSA